VSDWSLALVFVLAGAVTYATRLAGLALGDRTVPPAAARFLHFVPIAAFAALVAPGLGGIDQDTVPRLLAAAAASVAVVRYGRLWACIAVGMAVFWLARLAI
jgi:branched-subunit amino acid transport protein